MFNETIASLENSPAPIPAGRGFDMDGFTMETIDALEHQRLVELEQLRDSISRKTYFSIEEKIRQEKQDFLALFGWQEQRHSNRERFSLVLDTRYFEQKLMQA